MDLLSEHRIRVWLVNAVARALGRALDTEDETRTFDELGLSSLEAVVLAGDLELFLNRPIDANVAFDHPSIAALAQHLAEGVAHAA
jgi:polyketide synthase 13